MNCTATTQQIAAVEAGYPSDCAPSQWWLLGGVLMVVVILNIERNPF